MTVLPFPTLTVLAVEVEDQITGKPTLWVSLKGPGVLYNTGEDCCEIGVVWEEDPKFGPLAIPTLAEVHDD